MDVNKRLANSEKSILIEVLNKYGDGDGFIYFNKLQVARRGRDMLEIN